MNELPDGYRWALPTDTHKRARYRLAGLKDGETEVLPFGGEHDPYFVYGSAARPMVAEDRRDDE
jgi:hypothetical protein